MDRHPPHFYSAVHNRTVVVTLATPLPDGERFTVAVTPGLRVAGGGPVSGDLDRRLATLAGDVNGSGQVTAADIVVVREAAGKALAADTARFDVDRSGTITGEDMRLIRERIGTRLP